mmetsp:Transcript_11181/g.20467  ORF Transcript_11181/g.20467 Transcript_11181/m.20467 type:complete len:109 (-) Transcript_11181:29-355(-)
MPPSASMLSSATVSVVNNNHLNSGIPAASPTLDLLLTQSLSDRADPSSTLGFLTGTLNSNNQILHPCILVALFGGDDIDSSTNTNNNQDDGTISWNPTKIQPRKPRSG